MLCASRNPHQPMAVTQVLIRETNLLRTEQEGHSARGERLANQSPALLQTSNGELRFAAAAGGGADHEGTIGHRLRHALVLIRISKQSSSAYRRPGLPKSNLVGIYHAQVEKAEIAHSPRGCTDVERIPRAHQDNAQTVDFTGNRQECLFSHGKTKKPPLPEAGPAEPRGLEAHRAVAARGVNPISLDKVIGPTQGNVVLRPITGGRSTPEGPGTLVGIFVARRVIPGVQVGIGKSLLGFVSNDRGHPVSTGVVIRAGGLRLAGHRTLVGVAHKRKLQVRAVDRCTGMPGAIPDVINIGSTRHDGPAMIVNAVAGSYRGCALPVRRLCYLHAPAFARRLHFCVSCRLPNRHHREGQDNPKGPDSSESSNLHLSSPRKAKCGAQFLSGREPGLRCWTATLGCRRMVADKNQAGAADLTASTI